MKNTISNRLKVLVISIFALIVLGGTVVYFTIKKLEKRQFFSDNMKELNFLLSEQVKQEKNFMLSFKNEIEFFETGNSKTKRLWYDNQTKIINLLKKQVDNEYSSEMNIDILLQNILEKQEQYVKSSDNLVSKFKELGFLNFGLIGEMRKNIHQVEEMTDDEDFKMQLLSLRRYEKNLINRNDPASYDYFIRIFKDLNNNIAKGKYTVSQDVRKSLYAYNDNFERVNILLSQIGFKQDEGLRKEIEFLYQEMKPLINEVGNNVEKHIKKYKNNVFMFLILTLFLSLVLATVLLYFLNKSINQPISNLKIHIRNLSKGILPEHEIKLRKNDEIAEIAKEVNYLIKGLKHTTRFASEIGKGKLSNEYNPLSEKDALGNSLINMRNSLLQSQEEEIKRKEEDHKHNWATNGFAKFAELLRQNNDNLNELTYNIIKNLVKYLEANQAYIFILNNDNEQDIFYELKAAYAYNRRKFLNGKIHVGEGIAGIAIQEKETIYMNKVPTDYVNISSGIGQSKPRSVVSTPLKLGDEVYGVIEIASFNEYEKYQIEFIEKIAESVASTISSVRINEQTAQLLKESKKQANELATKEEQMRQNMEELQATQEESARKQAESHGFVSAVNHTIIRADFDTDGKLLYGNTRFLDFVKYSSEEVVNQPIGFFLEDSDKSSFSKEWQKLINGSHHIEKEIRFLTKKGKSWLLSTYTAMRKPSGEIFKVLFLGIDIDKQKRKTIDFEGELKAIDQSAIKAEFETNGNIIRSNEILLKHFGYDAHELSNKSVFYFVVKEDLNSFQNIWEDITKGKSYQSQNKRLTSKGKEIWLQETFTAVKNFDNQVYKIIYIAHDVTEQKKLEIQAHEQNQELQNQEKELRNNLGKLQEIQDKLKQKQIDMEALISSVDESLIAVEYSSNGDILRINERAFDVLGYNKDEIVGQKIGFFIPQNERQEFIRSTWREVLNGKSIRGTTRRMKKNGEECWIFATYTPAFDLNGKIYKIYYLGQDVSNQKNLELEAKEKNKQLLVKENELQEKVKEMCKIQNALVEKQNDMKSLFNSIDNVFLVAEYQPDGTIVRVNTKYAETAQLPVKAIEGKNVNMFIPPSEIENFSKIWNSVLDGRYFIGVNERGHGNVKRWLQTIYSPAKDAEGRIKKINFLALDITDQKLLEEKTKQQNEELLAQEEELRQNMEELSATQEDLIRKQSELKSLLDVIDPVACISEFNMQGKILRFNQTLEQIFGIPKEQAIGKNHKDFAVINNPTEYIQFWNDLKSGKTIKKVFYIEIEDRKIWLDETYSPVFDEKGVPISVLNIGFNISETMLRGERMKQQKEELIVHKEKIQDQVKQLNKAQKTLITKQGELSSLLDVIDPVICISEFDLNGEILKFNQTLERIFGITKEQAIGKNHRDFAVIKRAEEYLQFWIDLRNGKTIQKVFHVTVGENRVWLKETYAPILKADGTPDRILNIGFNITENMLNEEQLHQQTEELMAQEEELRQNLEELQSVQENLYDKQSEFEVLINSVNHSLYIVEFTPKGFILNANELYLNNSGYNLDELKSLDFNQNIPNTEKEKFEFIKNTIYSGRIWKGETCRLDKQKNEKWALSVYTPVFDSNGNILKIYYLGQDITEKKQQEWNMKEKNDQLEAAQEELKQNLEVLLETQEHLAQKEAQLNSVLNAVNTATFAAEFDIKGNVIKVNDALLKFFDLNEDDIKGKNIFDLEKITHKIDKKVWDEVLDGKIKKEYVEIKKGNKTVWLSNTYAPVFAEEKQPERVLIIAFDITQLKETTEKLKQREIDLEQEKNQMKSLISAIDKALVEVEFTPDKKIIRINENFTKVLQYTKEEVIGKEIEFYLSNKAKEKINKIWDEVLKGKSFKTVVEKKAKNNTVVWLQATYTPVFDIDGNIYKIYFLGQDITENKKRELEIIEQNAQLMAVEEELKQNVEYLNDLQQSMAKKQSEMDALIQTVDPLLCISEFDLDGNITDFNHTLEKIFGMKKEQTIGRNHRDFAVIIDEGEYLAFWKNLKRGKMQKRVFNIKTHSRDLWFSEIYTPVKDEDNNISKIINIGFDISEYMYISKRLNQDNENQKEQIEELQNKLDNLQNKKK